MMQAAKVRNGDHSAFRRMLDAARHGSVAIQRKMRARLVIVRKVTRENSTQVIFAEHDDVVQALSPNGSNNPFNEWILPGRSWGRHNLLDAHLLNASPEVVSVDAISIPNHETRRLIKRKRLDDLLPGPSGGWMWRYIEVNEPASVVSQHDQAV